jgi:hypothetical protein
MSESESDILILPFRLLGAILSKKENSLSTHQKNTPANPISKAFNASSTSRRNLKN